MHVVHLETGRQLYGGARQVLILAQGLKARGLRSTIACTAGSAIAAEAARAGLEVRELAMRGDLDVGFIDRLARELRALAPDLLHVHSRRGADWMGARAADRAGIRAVLSRRVDRPVGRWTARFVLDGYARIVAISQAIRRQLEEAGVEPARIRLIRSAVDPAPVEPMWSRERTLREFGVDGAAQLVACIAQLIPRKGHAALLEAWPIVRSQCPGAVLVLLGRGPLERSLRASVGREGLGKSVVFAGFRADLAAFLGRLDVLVHPALAEGLGLAVLEAQAAGVPVVACRSGGVPEIVEDGHTGTLVRSGDTAALASAIAGLLRDEPRRRAFGEAARTRAAREFGVADLLDAHLTLYRELSETPGTGF